MNLSRSVTTALLGTSLVGFAIVNAQAATVNITPGPAGNFFGYGTAVANNNVVNGTPTGTGTGASGVNDPSNLAVGVQGGTTAIVQSTVPLYTVTYYLAGSESGDTISFTSPLGTFTEGVGIVPNDANNNLNNLGGPQPGPILLGTTGVQSAQNLSFSFHDDTNNTGVANGSNNAANSGLPNMLFSYLQFISPGVWNLTSTATDWFLLGFNDSGSPDEDHDDLMIVGNITAVPIPAALGLFAVGLGLMGFLGRRRKRQASADLAVA